MFTSGRPGGKSFQAKVPDNIWWGSPTNLAALSSNRTISCTTNLPTNLPTNSHTSHYLDIISHEVCIHNTVIPYGKTIMQTSSHEILVQDRLDSFIHLTCDSHPYKKMFKWHTPNDYFNVKIIIFITFKVYNKNKNNYKLIVHTFNTKYQSYKHMQSNITE